MIEVIKMLILQGNQKCQCNSKKTKKHPARNFVCSKHYSQQHKASLSHFKLKDNIKDIIAMADGS